MKKNVRTRFAPSPTGYLHIGGLRTALYNFLYARKYGGQFYIRIEDTDQKRVVAETEKQMLESLHWAGIMPDEGVGLDQQGNIVETGEYSPYFQSKRLKIYQDYAHQLVQERRAYYCFCSPERLEELRERQNAQKKAPAYDKYCLREVPRITAEKRIKNEEEFVIRFDVPETGETEFEDEVRGKIKFANKNLDDFVILKSDGFPTYHLAHVVDDHLMKTSLVLRAEEWLPSTPKHLLLFEALRWNPPKYGHLCVILNKDTKKKLSKRDGDVSVQDFGGNGYLPEAVINFIALLGWNPKTERELFTLPELINEFELKNLNKAGAIFDIEKLNWMNGLYIRKKSVSKLAKLCEPYLAQKGVVVDAKFLEKILTVEKERLKTLADISMSIEFYVKKPDYEPKLLLWKKMTESELKKSLQIAKDVFAGIPEENWQIETIKEKLLAAADPQNRGELLWPARVALTGREKSPPPFEVAWVIGKTETVRRIDLALAH